MARYEPIEFDNRVAVYIYIAVARCDLSVPLR